MPLMKSKSKAAFSHNVRAELAAGKPLKQSLAIAYSTKRAAGGSHSGESQVTKRPSNTSSANPGTGKSWAQSPEPHSSHSAKRSEHYHKNVAQPVDSGATKMTHAQSRSRGKRIPGE